MAPSQRGGRTSVRSDSSDSSSPEREVEDDGDSIMEHDNDSQSSLGVSLEDMDLDSAAFEEQCRISPISRLPAELLIGIFSKLSSTSDLKNCMLVSKSWARNSVDLLWYRPTTVHWKNLTIVAQTASKGNGYFPYHDLVKRLNLSQVGKDRDAPKDDPQEGVNDGTLESLVCCKRIERLTLTDCKSLTDTSVAALINGNRSLLAVDLSGLRGITDVTLKTIAANCHRLQGLNIAKCHQVTDESLVEIARNCRRVKRLKFNECRQITDYAIAAFVDNCHEILEIDLHGCHKLTNQSVTNLIRTGRQLRELRLAQCTQISDAAFLFLPPAAQYDSLRILDLTECQDLQDDGVAKIVSAAPRLRNLVLAKCRNITDKGVMAICKLGKNLHYMHLGHCNRVTDIGVMALVKSCNRIRYIDLACCTELTDDSVVLLARLPKLKRIGLVKCNNITDRSLVALARAKSMPTSEDNMNNLERLHLSYCQNLTRMGVRTMLLHCPRLTHLSLTGVSDFLREDLLQFCKQAPEEFNEHQRDAFCVFSGEGVDQVRRHLRDHHAPPVLPDADDDADVTHHPHLLHPDPHHQPWNLYHQPPPPPPAWIYHGHGQPPPPPPHNSPYATHNAHQALPPANIAPVAPGFTPSVTYVGYGNATGPMSFQQHLQAQGHNPGPLPTYRQSYPPAAPAGAVAGSASGYAGAGGGFHAPGGGAFHGPGYHTQQSAMWSAFTMNSSGQQNGQSAQGNASVGPGQSQVPPPPPPPPPLNHDLRHTSDGDGTGTGTGTGTRPSGVAGVLVIDDDEDNAYTEVAEPLDVDDD